MNSRKEIQLFSKNYFRSNQIVRQYDRGGIFSGECNTTDLNHAITIVGYASSNGVNYWIIRNQWGTRKGIQGYWHMKMGINQCGLESWVMYPIIA